MPSQQAPYWRLSALYFFYFASVGVVLPYWALYLAELGFNAAQIGVIVSIPMVTKVLAPNVWGWLADRTGHYLLIIRLGALAAVIGFVGVLFRTDYWGLLVSAAVFTFFWNAILPQFEVITLDALGSAAHHYSRIRLWGSIGFIFAVVFMGWFFDHFSVLLLPWVLLCMLAIIALVTWVLPALAPHKHEPSPSQFLNKLFTRPVLAFLVASMLLQTSHGVFYGFYSYHLLEFGYTKTQIGLLWAIGVIAEIALFIKVPFLFARFNLWLCYLVGFIAAVIRWWVVAFLADVGAIMVAAQLLHAFTFGITHAVAIEIVRQQFGQKDRGKAQALYSALCFGGGGAIGAFSSGFIWQWGGAASFGFAAFIALLGCACVYWGMSAFRCSQNDRDA